MAQRFQKARRSPNGETSLSRVYSDANTKEPKEYWEYETLTVSWGCAVSSVSALPRAEASGGLIRGVRAC